MPPIGPDDVAKIARLARLKLDDGEREALGRDLVQILGYVEILGGLEIEGVEPTAHLEAQAASSPLRADEVSPGLDRAKALVNAPKPSDGFFEVPQILESGE